jgi:hypothetical protein
MAVMPQTLHQEKRKDQQVSALQNLIFNALKPAIIK